MTIQLITFDLDDTLWDTAPVIVSAEAVLREWLTEHAPKLGAVPVEHLWAIRERIINSEPGLKYRISALRRRVLLQALEEAGYARAEALDLAERSFEVFLHARHQLEIFPEVQPTLEVLANHYALGVVTNGNADVRRLGLADYFKFALCAEDIGIAKPDARLFHEALQRGGVTARAAVHIGDHPGDDIAGAQQAGLRAIWYNPAGKIWEAERLPDAEIRSLTELPALLALWNAKSV
ncbi:HAD family hydrolase [Pseudomonas sp. SDO55104_S430]